MPISTIIGFAFFAVGLWLDHRATSYGDAADWAAAKHKDDVAADLNEWATGLQKLAIACWGVTLGMTLGHALWPYI